MKYEPLKIEKEVLEFWEKKNIMKKVDKKRKNGSAFSFFDGPPTANNPMGVHHSWGRTYKDLFCRYKSMQGFNVRRQAGFDCQGLWVEVEVEKVLGFNTKKDIEKYGIEKFSKRCKQRVLKFVKVWVDLSKKLGMWMDWDNAYLTMSDNNIEHVWYFIKKCHEKGWLFLGERVLPWCPRCGTSLSSHEVAIGYKELTHDSVYLKFPVKRRKNEYLYIWTTTPWTLPADVAVAVHPDLMYLRVKQGEDVYIVCKDLVNQLDGEYEILEEMNGKKLKGLKYEMPYKDLPCQKGVDHTVVLWDEVSSEEGTGLVHTSPGTGPEDYLFGKETGLAAFCPVNEAGVYDESAGWLKGMSVKEANKLILEDLQKRGFVYKTEKYNHRYPCCWRCDEELIFRMVSEWFIGSEGIRKLLMNEAKKVYWSPDFSGKRMQDWLKNMKDWCISRKRYWGLPLPFWKCDYCDHTEIIGTMDELKQKAISGLDQLKELHRPWIDNVVIKCSKCGKEAHRIPDVGDCWLDAGIMPFSTLNYLTDRKYWEKWFPGDFITEMHEQVKLWFYSMLFMSGTIMGKTPYKTALTHGPVLDETGREMHKSWGNTILAEEALNKIGADIMRWMYSQQNSKFPIRFGYTPAKEVQKILNILFNTANYVKTYSRVNKFKFKQPKELDIASKWMLAKLQTVKKQVSKNLGDLKPHLATTKLQALFLDDFSRWYIHLVRDKVKEGYTGKDKKSVLFTLNKVMLEILEMLSPIIPFLPEYLYQDYFRSFVGEESIHLLDWPKPEKKYVNKKLEKEMKIVQRIVEASHAARQQKGLKLKWPVKQIFIVTEDESVKASVKTFEEILLKICNTKKLNLVEKEPKGKLSESEFNKGKLFLDLSEDQELREERLYRELTREIQALRKKYGFVVKDKIKLSLKSDAEDEKILKKFVDELKKHVGAKTVKVGKLEGKHEGKLEFRNRKIHIKFE